MTARSCALALVLGAPIVGCAQPPAAANVHSRPPMRDSLVQPERTHNTGCEVWEMARDRVLWALDQCRTLPPAPPDPPALQLPYERSSTRGELRATSDAPWKSDARRTRDRGAGRAPDEDGALDGRRVRPGRRTELSIFARSALRSPTAVAARVSAPWSVLGGVVVAIASTRSHNQEVRHVCIPSMASGRRSSPLDVSVA